VRSYKTEERTDGNMRKRLTWSIRVASVIVMMSHLTGFAQTAAGDSTAPVTIGGFVDTYFSLNFGRPISRLNRLTNFDLAESQFVLAGAELDIARAATPVGFRLELATGATADMNNSGPESARLFQQAYLTFVVPAGAALPSTSASFSRIWGMKHSRRRTTSTTRDRSCSPGQSHTTTLESERAIPDREPHGFIVLFQRVEQQRGEYRKDLRRRAVIHSGSVPRRDTELDRWAGRT